MYSLPMDQIDLLFENVGSKNALYIPEDNSSGKAEFTRWQKGTKLSNALKTVRSAKDFFFPKTENLVNFKMNGKKIEVNDPRKELEDFIIFGVRACDEASFDIVDSVYIKQNPVDTYYKNRRDHATVITLSCTEPKDTCFCKLYGINPANPKGDVSSWIANKTLYLEPNTEKGKIFIDSVKSILKEADTKEVDTQKKQIEEKVNKLPFVNLDLTKTSGDKMLAIFNSPVWKNLSSTCLGCGTCTYVCPTCMCFDVRSIKDNDGNIKQFRCWDSCMYSDFTKMAAANPRLTQVERFRQRFMHKLVYYPMDHNGIKGCVGCGRCLESCPIHMNIVKVAKAINATELTNGGKN